MTSLMTAAYADIGSTAIGLTRGFHEVGFLASQFEQNAMTTAFITRLAVTSVLVGIYAISKEYPNRLTFSVDKAARITNIITWGVVALNAVQLAIH